jgi:hypothetical protein
MTESTYVAYLERYRIVDRSADDGGITIEIEAFDAIGDPKWDKVPLSRDGSFLVPPGLMLAIIRRIREMDLREGGPTNGAVPLPAARMPRRVRS